MAFDGGRASDYRSRLDSVAQDFDRAVTCMLDQYIVEVGPLFWYSMADHNMGAQKSFSVTLRKLEVIKTTQT